MQTPAHQYKLIYSLVESSPKFENFTKSKNNRGDKIKKNPNEPAPGDYNTTESFNKT